jgi:hypothetical protein
MNAVKVWITIVFFLFVLVEAYQWVKGFILPLPIYVLAGAFLAIASNYDKGINILFRQVNQEGDRLSQSAILVDSSNVLQGQKEGQTTLPPQD